MNHVRLSLVPALALALGGAAALVAPTTVHADPGERDRVAFGGDVVVAPGEVVDSVAAFGGDAIVHGRVEGDVVSFGGHVELGPGAEVVGSVSSVGGQVHAAPGARWTSGGRAHPARSTVHRTGLGSFVEDAARQAVAHGLLFLLALVLMGLAPDRLGALQVVIVRDPVRSALHGLAGYVASITLVVALAVTLIGIPAAVTLALALPLATYLGLAGAATVIGAALPVEPLRDRPVHQLAAGVVVLFVASLVPFVGTLVVAAAACLGFGALLRTRFRPFPPADVTAPITPAGPYRTQSA